MAVNHTLPASLSIEEQTALARASLNRRIAAHRQEVNQLRENLGDLDEAWRRFVQETFEREALLATYFECGYGTLDSGLSHPPCHG